MQGSHRLAELRSLAYHREVAARLRTQPELLARGLRRLESWAASGAVHPEYVAQWRALLALPLDEVIRGLLDESEHGIALRQTTPFAGVLDARERWALWKDVRREFEASQVARASA